MLARWASEANLVKTVAEYNKAVKTKHDVFGRAEGVLVDAIDKPPFYAGRISMSVHHTMGGIHGTNRVGGYAIADIFVFGRIAGESAANQI